jgi:hypothetical protein
MGKQAAPSGSFRVPNSIVQGLTTNTAADLNRLTPFEMVMLLGLLTKVPANCPSREVRTTISELLRIVEVSRQVAHAVEREWDTCEGGRTRRRYQANRYSPTHLAKADAALRALFDRSVVIVRKEAGGGRSERLTHILDSFGYVYERDGKPLDLDDLPHGREKVNVGSDDRPVWRVRRRGADGHAFDRAHGVVFRLSAELASELQKKPNTIGFTLIAGRVFGLLRRYTRRPATLRLIVLLLRQTGDQFTRRLREAAADLGFDATHFERAVIGLEEALTSLRCDGLVRDFVIDTEADRLTVYVLRDWYKAPAPTCTAA